MTKAGSTAAPETWESKKGPSGKLVGWEKKGTSHVRRPHNETVPGSQALLDFVAAARRIHQHAEQLRMSGLRDEAIRNHEIAKRIENPIDFPVQRGPALARDPAQISGNRRSLPLQYQIKDQCGYGCNRRMEKARQPRHDREDRTQRRCIMKTMLVPARHFPPAKLWSPIL
jgi:hypothetical protein